MSSSRLLCLKFLKITNSLVCYQWPKVSSPPHYPSTNLHHSLFVCLTLHKMDISVRRTPLEPVLCPSYHLIESQMKRVKKGKNQLFRCWPFYRTVTVLQRCPLREPSTVFAITINDCCGYPVVLQRQSQIQLMKVIILYGLLALSASVTKTFDIAFLSARRNELHFCFNIDIGTIFG